MPVNEHVGCVNLFRLLNKVETDERTTTIKAMEIPHVGCIVLTIIKPKWSDIPYSISSCFVPGVKVVDNASNDGGRHLETISISYIS